MSLCSMTGFGRYQTAEGGKVQIWEVRSVNGRYLDLKWRLPMQARPWESRLEKMVRRHAARGRVEINLALQNSANACVAFDHAQATAVLDSLSAFAQSRGDVWEPDYTALLSLSSLWTAEAAQDDDSLALWLEKGLEQALKDWNTSRKTEGAELARDLRGRFARMTEWVSSIEERAPAIKEERFCQVRERLGDMLNALGADASIAKVSAEANSHAPACMDDSRFLQEMVILADRLDVSEELTRLRSHLARLDMLLDEPDSGRKLDFTLQECFREINTCGNKIQDIGISRLIVDLKNELEKCREQVQNLE